jgi:hypothetical protein
MKNTKTSPWLLLFTLLLFNCERDLETEGLSRITYYPDFVMAGEANVITWVGAGYSDPGATASEAGQDLPVTVTVTGSPYIVPGNTQPAQVTYTNAFDGNVPGIYLFRYSAINSDGFPGSVTRRVFVLDKQPDPSVDLSGTYPSTAPSPNATITKVGDGVFFSTNAWGGGSGVVISAYILTSDGVNLNVPQQESLVRIFGYGTRLANGTLDLKMSRPTFSPPIIDLEKVWAKQ